MIKERLWRLIFWEAYNIQKRGFWVVPAFLNFMIFFYLVPLAFHSIYSYLPSQNMFLMYSVGTTSLHIAFKVLYNFFYIILYYFDVERFKINPGKWPWQDNKNFIPETKDLIRTLIINTIIITPILTGIFSITARYDLKPKVPDFKETLLQMAIFTVYGSINSHFTHVVFHQPRFYGMFHKQHHDYKMVMAATAEYAHPVEFVITNSLSLGIGPLIYGQSKVHIITWYTWLIFRLASSIDVHSGYEFPFSPFHLFPFSTSPEYHSYHHHKNIGTYGSYLTIWDTILGTDQEYHDYIQKANIKKEN